MIIYKVGIIIILSTVISTIFAYFLAMTDFSLSMDELVSFAFANTAPNLNKFIDWLKIDMHPPGYYFFVFIQSIFMDLTPLKIRAFNHFSSIVLLILGLIIFLDSFKSKKFSKTKYFFCFSLFTLMTFSFAFFWGNLSEARANCFYYSLTYLLCVSLMSKSKVWTNIFGVAIQWTHPFGVILTFIIFTSEFLNNLFQANKSGIKIKRIILYTISRYLFVICSAIAVILFMVFFSGALYIREVSGEGQDFIDIIKTTKNGFGNYALELYISAFVIFSIVEFFSLFIRKKNNLKYTILNLSTLNFITPIIIFISIVFALIFLKFSFFQFKYIAPLFIYFVLILCRQCLINDKKFINFLKVSILFSMLFIYLHSNFLQHRNIWKYSNLPKQNNYEAIKKACNISDRRIPVVTSYFLPDQKNQKTLDNLLKPYIPKNCDIFVLTKQSTKHLKCNLYANSNTILFLHYSPSLINQFIKKCGGKYVFSDYAYVVTN